MRLFEITKPSQVELLALAKEIRGVQTHDQIKSLVMKHFPMTTAKAHTVDDVDSGEMNISAHYDPDVDEEGGLPIHIDLMFSKKDDENVEWTKQGRKFFLYKLQDVMKHELLHLTQHRTRDFHPGRDGYDNRSLEYEYMSRPDEIEAYAMNIADELKRAAGLDGAFQLLRMAKKTAQFKDELGRFLSPDLLAYFALFKFDSANPVIKKLLKKIYIYLKQSK
tara:strand:+ start:653 stop:1315 length:663 start_codon:yes stop_codon:yes gene_type:complete